MNPYSILYGHGGLTIGDKVLIAAHCVVIPANHGIALNQGTIRQQPQTKCGIRINSDVWLAAGVRVLDGVEIKEGCVIAAGAVVSRSTDDFGIYAGVPAKMIKSRT